MKSDLSEDQHMVAVRTPSLDTIRGVLDAIRNLMRARDAANERIKELEAEMQRLLERLAVLQSALETSER